MPTVYNYTVKESGGDYASVVAAEAAMPASLVTDDSQWNFEISGTWSAFEGQISLTTQCDVTRYAKFEAVGDSKAVMPLPTDLINGDGTHWGAKKIHDTQGYGTIDTSTDYYRLIGLYGVGYNTSGSGRYAYGFGAEASSDNVFWQDCIGVGVYNSASDQASGAQGGFACQSTAGNSGDLTYRNCISVGTNNAAGRSKTTIGWWNRNTTAAQNMVLENCTSVDTTATTYNSGTFVGYHCGAGATMLCTNCVADANGNAGTKDGFLGDFTGSDYCASSEAADCTGANSIDSVVVTWVDPDNSGDFHLSPTDTGLWGNGVDLSGTFTTDIDGDTRVAWSIGADDGLAQVDYALELSPASFAVTGGGHTQHVAFPASPGTFVVTGADALLDGPGGSGWVRRRRRMWWRGR